jgi:hypothetical protein
MKNHPWLLLGLLFLGGCATGTVSSAPTAHTLRGTSRLPEREIADFYPPGKWERIRDLEYAGYVVLDGWVGENGRVRTGRIVESFPDHSRDQIAHSFAATAKVRSVTAESNIRPKVRVYVVFFEKMLEGDFALVFAKQTELAAGGPPDAGRYLDTIPY